MLTVRPSEGGKAFARSRLGRAHSATVARLRSHTARSAALAKLMRRALTAVIAGKASGTGAGAACVAVAVRGACGFRAAVDGAGRSVVVLVARTFPHIIASSMRSTRQLPVPLTVRVSAHSGVPNAHSLTLSAEPMRGALFALLSLKLGQALARPAVGALPTP